MDVIRPNSKRKKIRQALVFFCTVLFLSACASEVFVKEIQLQYKNDAAYAVQFVSNGFNEHFKIFLKGEKETPVLGELTTIEDEHWFSPAVAFTRGNTYEIYYKSAYLDAFTIPTASKSEAPEIVNIFPSKDTVPENLLKIYLQFSKPMQEVGNALDFITVFDETENKEVKVFLELEAELWNAAHDRLTLWLDPGRIKTDLIPNKAQGLPLLEGHRYRIEISDSWKDAKGIPLKQGYQKKLFVTEKDQEMPKHLGWKIQIPKPQTQDTLKVVFGEALDAILARETIFLTAGASEEIVSGNSSLNAQEDVLYFVPVNNWKKGTYVLNIHPKLEDLAGNNLSHLFDTDNTTGATAKRSADQREIRFKIQ